MTLQEANTKLYLETEMLQRYEKIGLIKGTPLDDGTMDYPIEELQRTIQLNFLEKAGMNTDSLKHFVYLLEQGEDAKTEVVRLLRKCRNRLLDEIHDKQQLLDQLDYLIYQINHQKGGDFL